MGNETEFKTRNKFKWETRRVQKHNFSTENKKNREKQEKLGENTKKQGTKLKKKKNRKLQEIQKQDETRYLRDKISMRQDFVKISGNAENGNKNKVFLNVTNKQFKSKNKVSVPA